MVALGWRGRRGGKEGLSKRNAENLESERNVCSFNCAMVSRVYKYVKTYQIVFFKYVQLIISQR